MLHSEAQYSGPHSLCGHLRPAQQAIPLTLPAPGVLQREAHSHAFLILGMDTNTLPSKPFQ
jgi:uncharacterized membrane protein